jgi:hypothetical protein
MPGEKLFIFYNRITARQAFPYNRAPFDEGVLNTPDAAEGY